MFTRREKNECGLEPVTLKLMEEMLAGNRRALARLMSMVEDDGDEAHALLAAIHPYTGKAHIIGVTGAPGTGKSTLVNELAQVYRRQDITVGIVAVDPTSPFSGGALLGDRIRMRELSGDPGIFIRSMASRGSLGGLACATDDVIKLLDAAGYKRVIVETVGAGQTEVEIARTAHTTIVLEVPGLGDDIQAIKAGLLEIADILVVNKADKAGADTTVTILQAMLDLNSTAASVAAHHTPSPPAAGSEEAGSSSSALAVAWRSPIIKTVAIDGTGAEELVAAIEAHAAFLRETGLFRLKEKRRAEAELRRMLSHALISRFLDQMPPDTLSKIVERIVSREIAPYTAVEELLSGAGSC